jgi:hypothetical protein
VRVCLQLLAEEDEAERILERLDIGVGAEVVLADDVPHAVDRLAVVADIREDVGQLGGVDVVEIAAPAEVASAAGGVGVARDGPPADVVAAGGEQERLVSIGPEALHPVGHQGGVVELLRTGAFGSLDARTVFRVRGVDAGDREVKPLVHESASLSLLPTFQQS